MSACLLACLLACLPAFLPACLCELMVAYLLACLSLPAWLFACRCLHASIHSCIPSFINSSNYCMPFQSMPSFIYSIPLRAILAPSCLSCHCLPRTTGLVCPGSPGSPAQDHRARSNKLFHQSHFSSRPKKTGLSVCDIRDSTTPQAIGFGTHFNGCFD